MSMDLKLLVWSAALTFLQVVIAAGLANMQIGLPALAGNREGLPALTGMAGRAKRAHANMLESLVLFAVLVLVAHVAGRANATTALGAQLFFWARIAYAGLYLAGIPWVRTGAWAVSILGLVLIFLQLL
ncbi:MAG: MAPEG family protein [Phreatobacter sp.]|uniref:MAPEG family protein n=1 Tax=Phreatobacter sp. TaxID=1966341 RepID=UPI001A5DD067|nr:MAPEG family protein [Phreatobacter sp.]MBL8567721.1 MAPEG family protein [Phreatobacter sp.]